MKKRKGKILLVIGTRPEAIKMAPIVKELKNHRYYFEIKLCVTGQHSEMLNQVLNLFELIPDYNLGLMQPSQTLDSLTSKTIIAFNSVLKEFNPECVLVQGDTTTAMACALSAFYQKVPVGHVEAGLRTNNIYFPFPEEMNRRLISQMTTYHFAPTQTAVEALLRESIDNDKILLTGNTVIDSLYWVSKNRARLPENFELNSRKMILVTAHRRENWGSPLKEICDSILELKEAYSDIEFVYPVHRNPNVWNTVHEKLAGNERIHLLPPVRYDVLVGLMQQSYLILTDSGGIQEEAPALGKPVLVLRNETERPEAVNAGVVKLVGTNKKSILMSLSALLSNDKLYKKMSNKISPYGDGHAAKRIVSFLRKNMSIN